MNQNRVNLDFIGYPNYSVDIKGDIYSNRHGIVVKIIHRGVKSAQMKPNVK